MSAWPSHSCTLAMSAMLASALVGASFLSDLKLDVRVGLHLEADMDKTDDAVRVLITDPVLQKRLAKYLVQRCFRNSVLDDLHAGIAPDSKAGDYSDVVVSTPFGEIPWSKLSRFDDEEMKTLMIDVVQKTYEFIQELFDVENGGELLLRLAARDPLPRWENPR